MEEYQNLLAESKPVKRQSCLKVFLYFALIFVIIAFISALLDDNSSIDSTSEKPVISREEYIASCEAIPYNDIARNPNNYIGKHAVFTGEVVQVQESGEDVMLRVAVTEDEYGIWDDIVYVDYERKYENESRILENDTITLYGEVNGIKKYTAVFGNEISIPHILAEYIVIN